MHATPRRFRLSRAMAWVGAVVLFSSLAAAATPATITTLTPDQGALTALLQSEVMKAQQEGKVPFVQITAEWCGPCKSLRASMNDKLMKDAFAGTYIVRIDMDAWKSQLDGAGLKTEFVPIFFALNPAGRPTGKIIHGGAWAEDIPRNMAPPLRKFFRENGAKP
jgi:thiol-disulfide isomerase/thioredoxin